MWGLEVIFPPDTEHIFLIETTMGMKPLDTH